MFIYGKIIGLAQTFHLWLYVSDMHVGPNGFDLRMGSFHLYSISFKLELHDNTST